MHNNDTDCIFCTVSKEQVGNVLLSNEYCMFLQYDQEILIGSGIIVPRRHCETVFDLNENEWKATFDLLIIVKQYLDHLYKPQGYNVGWNVGTTGGQEIFHAHLHVIPRYNDEPLAGKGIRYWLKQSDNMRIVQERIDETST